MKRLLAFLVCLSLLLTCMSGITLTAFAASDVITNAGISGAGTAEAPYIIDSAAKFVAVFGTANTDTANTFSSTYYLTADVDLSGLNYVPNTASFSGSLIGWDAENSVKAKREINIGTISHAGDSSGNVGGVINFATCSTTVGTEISYLVVRGKVTAESTATAGIGTGGLIGYAKGNILITNVDNYATVDGRVSIGGIIGCTYSDTMKIAPTVEYCNNYGLITCSYGGYGVAGINGMNYSVIKYCNNYGVIDSSDVTNNAGGIVGQMYADVLFCSNTASITSKGRAGGIASYCSTASVKTEGCWNSGNVTASSSNAAGGIVGGTYAYTTMTDSSRIRPVQVINCYNRGIVKNTSNSKKAGAAIGDTYASGYQFKYNSTSIDGSSRLCVINGFYDVANSGMSLTSTTFESATTYTDITFVKNQTVSNAYIIANSESTDSTGTQYVTSDSLKALTTSGYFADSSVWETYTDYPYPSIVGNAPVLEDDSDSDIFSENEISGSGTAADPYIIDSADKFKAIFSTANSDETELAVTHAAGTYYLQTADIKVDEFSPNGTTFKGIYRGGSIAEGVTTLSNKALDVKINEDATQGVAIFPYFSGATFSHITVKGSVTGGKYTAGLAGEDKNDANPGTPSTISNIINEAVINGVSHAGGIVGLGKYGLTITNCTNVASVNTTSSNYAGGIIGWANLNNKLTNCVNTGAVTSTANYAGGIAGAAYDSRIERSYNTGTVKGEGNVGGIVGGYMIYNKSFVDAEYHGIHESYNSGVIEGGSGYAGGLMGSVGQRQDIKGNFSITNSYNAGSVITTSKYGPAGAIGSITINASTTVDNVPTYTINGFYNVGTECDTIGNVDTNITASNITVPDTYVLSSDESTEYKYATKADKNTLKALTSSGSGAFADTSVWTAGSGKNPYPALVNNPYQGLDLNANYALADIEGYYENGAYYLKWTAENKAESYKIIVDSELVATVSEFPVDITEYVKNKVASIRIVPVSDGTDYTGGNISFNGNFAGGTGVSGDPYKIADKDHLANIAKYRSAYYEQINDITGVTEPIMLNTSSNSFIGKYDGNDKTIEIALVTPSSWPTATSNNGGFGLFPVISTGAEIKDLTITGTVNSTRVNTGALVGVVYNNTFTISGIKNHAKVSSSQAETAGIVGRAYKTGTIENCYNYADVTGTRAAGIVGCTNSSTVVDSCGNYGTIKATSDQAGGIATYCYGGASNCFNVGTIIGKTNAAGIMAGMQPVAESTAKIKVVNCYNLGTLVAPTTYGISYKKATVTNWYGLENCYNAVYATYPLADVTADTLEGTSYTVSGNHYLTTDTEDKGDKGKTPVTSLAALKEIDIDNTAYSISGNLVYPQLTNNKLDSDRDSIDLALVTVNTSALANTEAAIENFDKASFYVQKGFDGLTVAVTPSTFYSIEVFKGEGSLGVFIEDKELSVTADSDIVISFAEAAITPGTPEISTADDIFEGSSEEPITVGETTYTRYALAAGKAGAVSGLKLKEAGILINTSENDFNIETAKAKAEAGEGKISSNGAYGILIYGDTAKGLQTNKTYYTKPYAIYVDKDDNEVIAYGVIRSFVITVDAPNTDESIGSEE